MYTVPFGFIKPTSLAPPAPSQWACMRMLSNARLSRPACDVGRSVFSSRWRSRRTSGVSLANRLPDNGKCSLPRRRGTNPAAPGSIGNDFRRQVARRRRHSPDRKGPSQLVRRPPNKSGRNCHTTPRISSLLRRRRYTPPFSSSCGPRPEHTLAEFVRSMTDSGGGSHMALAGMPTTSAFAKSELLNKKLQASR